METEVLDARPFKQVVETPFHTLPSVAPGSGGKIRSSPMTAGNRRSSPASSESIGT
jgi:hypothetical protein